jgi:hypothetical protein
MARLTLNARAKKHAMIVTSCQQPKPANRDVARRHAKAIAAALASKAISYGRITLGEPQCHFRVPCHIEDFWCKVLISDDAFVFVGQHKRANAFSSEFCASLKYGWSNMIVTRHLPSISKHLAVDVYTQPERSEASVATVLLSPSVKPLIAAIDFDPIALFFLNSLQITVVSKFVSHANCAEQVRLFRHIIEATFAVSSCPRYEKPAQPGASNGPY